MNRINFFHNWNNKLDLDIFTTIRRYDNQKYNYYSSQKDKSFIVCLNKIEIKEVVLLSVEIAIMRDVPKGLICMDTGLAYKEATKIFNKFGIDLNTKIIVLTFKSNEN